MLHVVNDLSTSRHRGRRGLALGIQKVQAFAGWGSQSISMKAIGKGFVRLLAQVAVTSGHHKARKSLAATFSQT